MHSATRGARNMNGVGGMYKRNRLNPRTLFGWSLIAPHVLAFEDDPDDDPEGGAPPPDPLDPGAPHGGVDPPEPRTFSQDEVNRIAAKRAEKERQATERRLLEELGYTDIDEARQAKAKRTEAAEAKLLEEKKYGEVIENRDAELLKLRAELQQERNQRQSETILRTVLAAATDAGAVQADQVAQLTRGNFKIGPNGSVQVVNPATGEVETDGNGSELTAKAFLTRWLENNPHYQRAASGRGSNSGGPGGGAPRSPGGFDPTKKGDLEHLRENRDELIRKANAGEIEL